MQWVDFEKIDLRLAVTDSPVGGQPEMLPCPQHDDSTQSMAVYPDNIHCFGCQFHIARRLEGLAFLLHTSVAAVLAVAGKYTTESLDAYRQRVTEQAATDPLPRGLAITYVNLLWRQRTERLDYLRARGLSDDSIVNFYLGHDGTRFVLPIFDHTGKLLTLRYRRDDHYETSYFDSRRGREIAVPKYSGMRGRNGQYLFPEWEIAVEAPEYLVVVEGELDAVRLWQAGIPAVSTTNGAGQVHRIPALLREKFPQITTLFIATDQDAPGDEARHQTYHAAKDLGLRATTVTWDAALGKDVTELYLNGHTLEEATFGGDDATLPD
jgi:DNA primase